MEYVIILKDFLQICWTRRQPQLVELARNKIKMFSFEMLNVKYTSLYILRLAF